MVADRLGFDDLARKIAQAEVSEKQTTSIQLITFKRNTQPSKRGLVGFHPIDNRPVFPDERRMGRSIKEGETWFCELQDFAPASGSHVYYANPIQRVDAGFLFDLRLDQVNRLVDALRLSADGKLLEQARSQFKREAEQESKAAIDSVQAQAEISKNEVTRLTKLLEETQQEANAVRAQVEAYRLTPPAEVGAPTLKSADPRPTEPEWEPLPEQGLVTIARPEPDLITSAWLRQPFYDAFVSPDRRTLLLRPAGDRGIPVVRHQLRLPSLPILRPFDHAEKLTARFDARRGGLIVELTGGSIGNATL